MVATLMAVFTLGWNTCSMAEKMLSFYGLIVAMITTAGNDGVVRLQRL
jgi:uncharacterized ion transporter superfamily protein YfcC